MATRFTGTARSGISPVTLVVFILLSLVAGIIAFVMYTKQVKAKIELDRVRMENADATRKLQEATSEMLSLRGYLVMERASADSVQQYFKDLDIQGLPVDPKNFRAISRDLDLWALRLSLANADLVKRVGEATVVAETVETARDATRDNYNRRVQEKNADLRKLDEDLKTASGKKEDLIKQYNDEKKGFTDKYNNARDEHETRKASLLRDAEKLTRKNAVVRRDLKVLRPEPSIHPPAGHVVRSDWKTNKVVVDLGERERVFPGLVLEAYSFDRNGRRVVKGKVEIMTVFADSSVCSVVENDVKDPIIAGDPVQTRMLPVRPGQKFVIAGFIPPDAPYDEDKLKAIIKLNGGEVQEAVGLSTDCLILGETAAYGLGDLDKRTAEMAPDKTRRGLDQAEVARELSIDIVDYDEFIEGLLH